MAPGDIYTRGVRPRHAGHRHHHGHRHHGHRHRHFYGGYPYFYDYGPSYYYDDAYYYDDGPSYSASYDDDDVARCAARYRSFDPATGTFLHVSGERRLCSYLR